MKKVIESKQNNVAKEVKVVKEEKNVMTVAEVWETLTKEQKKDIFVLIGEACMTEKRVSIPKAIYTELNKNQKLAVRKILDSVSGKGLN